MNRILLLFIAVLSFSSCSVDNTNDTEPFQPRTIKLLALGDSYTIGQSVCNTCRFPEQLKDNLKPRFNLQTMYELKVVATTGWTTTNLINAIESQNILNNYDLVTLLIGVNNQFQGKPFSLYEEEFPILVTKAITFAKGDKSRVIVVSIPDYAFTTFGQNTSNPQQISTQIDQYNAFAQTYCQQNDITFVNITDITREGIDNPELVASDGLHPSELAYTKFVERLLPIALEKIQ